MRTLIVRALSLLLVSLFRSLAQSDHDVLVLVPPFENLSSRRAETEYTVASGATTTPRAQFRIDRYSHAPREVLEDIVTNIEGVKPVERQRLDQVLLEVDGRRFQSFSDNTKTIKLAVQFHATSLIKGTIVDVTQSAAQFEGYGVKVKNTVWKATVRVHVVNIVGESTKIAFSKILVGTCAVVDTPSLQIAANEADIALRLIQDALEPLRNDKEFRVALRAGPKATDDDLDYIQIFVESKPDKADVFIDGRWIGQTPCRPKLRPNKEVTIKVEKKAPMCESWEARISPERGMRIDRDLTMVPLQTGHAVLEKSK